MNATLTTWQERSQYAAARLLSHLPDRVKVLLSGEPPVIVDGQRLDPQIQLLRSFTRRRRTFGLIEPTIAAGRARYRRQTETFRGPVTAIGGVRDLDIPGAAGPLRARHYTPPLRTTDHCGLPPVPLTVYLHGGGFVIGDLDTHDEPCRLLCRHAGVHVLSVDYRLAPEHPFPAAIEDARAAFQWARANAAALGADPSRVAIGGDSAGANLAAVVSAGDACPGPPFAQLLIYPPTDMTTHRRSRDLFSRDFFLTLHDLAGFFACYAGDAGACADPRLSPLLTRDLSRVPPSLVAIAGFDILRDDGEAYAAALDAVGTPVKVDRFPALGHGFIHMTGVCPAARRAMLEIARGWRLLLDERSAGGA